MLKKMMLGVVLGLTMVPVTAMASPMPICAGTIAMEGRAFHQDVSVMGNVRLSPIFPGVIETVIGHDTVSLYVRESGKNPGKLLVHLTVIKRAGIGNKAEVAHPHGEITMGVDGYQPLSDGFKAKANGCASNQK